MDATYITALRTGAMAGVAAKYLPCRKKGAVGVIGAGAVARWGLTYLNRVMSIERVLIYSRSPESTKAFAREAKKITKAHVEVLGRPDPVASSADVLLCATSSKDPVFDGKVLRGGSLVISLGANTPDTREIDSTTVLRSKIIVDSIESALKECGEFILPIREGLLSSDRVAVELGQIISGEVKELSGHEEIVLMKSVGLAAVDAVVASYVYERAVQWMRKRS
jgi:ornithine cyclodeaminase/alanine dehydrogenase-like protein (mu-crystallin family)